MKRIAPFVLVVLALAAVPAALADTGTPVPTAPAPTGQAGQAQPRQQRAAGGAGIRARLEILRLELRLVQLRFAVNCHGGVSGASQTCVDFAQKAEQRLQTLDANVQKRIAALQGCTPSGADATCRNADRKLALLQKVDTKVQALIQKVQDWLAGKATTVAADPTSDSSLDQAANGLGQLAQGLNP